MRISDWSSDVCSSDLIAQYVLQRNALVYQQRMARRHGGYQRIVPHRLGEDAIAHLIGLGKAHIVKIAAQRSEERRVGQECVSTCRSRWSPYHKNKNTTTHIQYNNNIRQKNNKT